MTTRENNKIYNDWKFIIALLLISLLAFILRSIPYKNFIAQSGEYLFYSNDSYDHLRHVALIFHNFPDLPARDYYWGYPEGSGTVIWTPTFDWIVAAVAVLLSGITAINGEEILGHIGFWVSPFFGFLAPLLTYFLGARLFSKESGLIAALFVALLPGHIYYTFVSEFDHHSIEPILCLLVIYSHSFGVKSSGSSKISMKAIAFPMIVMLFALLAWRGSVVFWGCVIIALFLQSLKVKSQSRLSLITTYSALLLGGLAIILAPLCYFEILGASSKFLFNIVSWFHVVLCLICCAIFMAIRYFRGGNVSLAAKSGVLAVILLALWGMVESDFFKQFMGGLSVVGAGKDPWLDTISELRSLIYPNGTLNISHAGEMLSWFYWLFPGLLFHFFAKWWRNGEFDEILFLSFGTLFWVLPLFRERYVHMTTILLALGAGYFLVNLWKFLMQKLNKLFSFAFTFTSGTLLLVPVFPFLTSLHHASLPSPEKFDLPAAMEWLREYTPRTSYYLNPVKRPEYGVISEWSLGPYISTVGQRPSLATAFGWETYGLYPSSDFLTTDEPERARNILIANNIRYVVLQRGVNLTQLHNIVLYDNKKQGKPDREKPLNPLKTMYYRLYYQNGKNYNVMGVQGKVLPEYRLVYQSKGGFFDRYASFVPYYKIFEFQQEH